MKNKTFRSFTPPSAGVSACRTVYFSFFILHFSIFLFATGCQQKTNHEGRLPVAEVNGIFLYEEDVLRSLPLNLPREDSARYADDFIRNWVEETLLYQQAEHNVKTGERIEQMVQAYRKSLIIQDYQQQLIAQYLSEELTEEEMLRFYDGNK